MDKMATTNIFTTHGRAKKLSGFLTRHGISHTVGDAPDAGIHPTKGVEIENHTHAQGEKIYHYVKKYHPEHEWHDGYTDNTLEKNHGKKINESSNQPKKLRDILESQAGDFELVHEPQGDDDDIHHHLSKAKIPHKHEFGPDGVQHFSLRYSNKKQAKKVYDIIQKHHNYGNDPDHDAGESHGGTYTRKHWHSLKNAAGIKGPRSHKWASD